MSGSSRKNGKLDWPRFIGIIIVNRNINYHVVGKIQLHLAPTERDDLMQPACPARDPPRSRGSPRGSEEHFHPGCTSAPWKSCGNAMEMLMVHDGTISLWYSGTHWWCVNLCIAYPSVLSWGSPTYSSSKLRQRAKHHPGKSPDWGNEPWLINPRQNPHHAYFCFPVLWLIKSQMAMFKTPNEIWHHAFQIPNDHVYPCLSLSCTSSISWRRLFFHGQDMLYAVWYVYGQLSHIENPYGAHIESCRCLLMDWWPPKNIGKSWKMGYMVLTMAQSELTCAAAGDQVPAKHRLHPWRSLTYLTGNQTWLAGKSLI